MKKSLFGAIASLLFYGGSAVAMPTDSVGFELDQVVISALRWQQPKKEQPKRIIAITPRQVRFQNPQTTADLLGISGEVFIQKSQLGGGSPMIRGCATNRLLYAIDGIRMNTAIFRSGNLQNVISIDPFSLEKTEVLFGPGSVSYGSDAMGGVMSFTTKQAQLSQSNQWLVKGSATARHSSANNERTGHFDISVGGSQWAFLTSISSFHFGDLRQGSHGPVEYLKPFLVQRQNGQDVAIDNPNPLIQSPSGYSQINLMQKIRFKPSDAWDLQYAFHYSETSDYDRYDRHTRLRKGIPRYGEWKYGPQTWMLNQLTVAHDKSTWLYDRLAVRLGMQQFGESRIDRGWNKNIRTTTREKVDAYSLNADFAKALSETIALYYGTEYVCNQVRSQGEATDIISGKKEAAPSRYPQAVWQSAAAHLQAVYKYSSFLNVEAGVRYNFYQLQTDFSNHNMELSYPPRQTNKKGALTGNIGVALRPASDWQFSLNASRGFRTPNVDDMGKLYESVDNCVVVPNPNLKPEYAHSIEASLAKQFANVLHLEVAAYYTHISNAMVRRDFKFNGQDSIFFRGEKQKVLAIQNAAAAYVYGLHFDTKVYLPMGFELSTQFNWQRGKEELDNGTHSPLRHAAPFFGKAALAYTQNRLQMELYTLFQGKRSHADMPEEEKTKTEMYALDANGKVYAPAWITLNLKAQYKAGTNLWLNVGVENLTDLRYRYYSSGISAPGRNFIASVTYNF